MIVKLLLGLLPKRYRNLIKLGIRLTANLNTEKEREAVITEFTKIIEDGRVTPPEWSRLGKVLKIWDQKDPSVPVAPTG